MVQKSKKPPPPAKLEAVAPKRRGRPRAYQPEVALGKALDLFRKDGFAATSLDDLSAATGMNRPSLYGAFGDKRGLYLKSYARYRADARTAMIDIFVGVSGNVAALVFALLVWLLLNLFMARRREFAADAGSMAVAGDPRAMISGLARLADHREPDFIASRGRSRGAAGSRGWAAKPAHCLSAKPYWVKAPTR